MRIVKTSYMRPDPAIVDEAIRVIKKGGLVVGVTDTVYGLFTNPLSRDCVKRVYQAKERVGKPIPILISSIDSVVEAAEHIDEPIKCLMRLAWPGPLTIIIPIKKGFFPEEIHLGTNKVGFRMPAAPLPRLIAEHFKGYVTGTSANLSGRPAPRTIDGAVKQLGDRINLYIDSGTAPIGTASTVIEIVDGRIKYIRRGSIEPEVIESLWRYCLEHYCM